MPQEMVQEAVEIVTMSVDKFINVKNYEVNSSKLDLTRCALRRQVVGKHFSQECRSSQCASQTTIKKHTRNYVLEFRTHCCLLLLFLLYVIMGTLNAVQPCCALPVQ